MQELIPYIVSLLSALILIACTRLFNRLDKLEVKINDICISIGDRMTKVEIVQDYHRRHDD